MDGTVNILDFVRPGDGLDMRPALRRAFAKATRVMLPPGEYNLNSGTTELTLAGAIVGAPADPEAFG